MHTLAAFLSASFILSLVPGPDNIFVLSQSAVNGWRKGIAVTSGLCCGLIVHTTAVALGAAVIFEQSVAAFSALKFAGAAYLLFLAYGAFRAGPVFSGNGETRSQSDLAMFVRGIVMNVTNPKVAIFFLAFLPQFAAADNGSVGWQIVGFGMLFIVVAFSTFSIIAVVSGKISEPLQRSERMQIMLNKISGMVFLALAFKLATSER